MRSAQEKRVIVVIGAGRTGTSLLMQILNMLGMSVSERMTPPSEQNIMGGYEDSAIFAVQTDIFNILNTKPVFPLPDNWIGNPKVQAKKEELAKIIETNVLKTGSIWGVKDPRTALLLPLWIQIFNSLKLVPSYVLAVRDPVSTISSLQKQYNYNQPVSELFWLHKNCSAIIHTSARCFVVHFEDWFVRPEELANELIQYTGLNRYFNGNIGETIREIVKPTLNRSIYQYYRIKNNYVNNLYDALKSCRGDVFDREHLMFVVQECFNAIEGFKGWYLEAIRYFEKQNMLTKKITAKFEDQLKFERKKSTDLVNQLEIERKKSTDLVNQLEIDRKKSTDLANQLENENKTATYVKDRLNEQINSIENSSSFKIGKAFILAFKEPGVKTIRLPYDLMVIFLNIIKNYFTNSDRSRKNNTSQYHTSKNDLIGLSRKSKKTTSKSVVNINDIQSVQIEKLSSNVIKEHENRETIVEGEKILNKARYTKAGQEDHIFSLFNEFKPFRTEKNSRLKIACIASSELIKCLKFEAELLIFSVDDWSETFDKEKPDFLLVQSCIGKPVFWKETITSFNRPSANMLAIVQYCKENKIPTVFWDTKDHVHLNLFLNTAAIFEFIFVDDIISVEKYGKITGKNVLKLGPAIQPVLHNPLRREGDSFHGFTYLFDGWADIIEYPKSFDFLKPLLPLGLHIVESRYIMRANKLEDLPEFRENVMGCLSYNQLLTALRYYQAIIIYEKSLSSTLVQIRSAMEALACGCNVILYGENSIKLPVDFAFKVKNPEELHIIISHFPDNSLECQKKLLMARRALYASHTYAHRIKAICDAIGIHHGWEEDPPVSVILPTKRPEMISSCIQKFKNQNYPKKELVLVINSNQVNIEKIQKMASDQTNIKIIQLHQENPIGVCLNLGISLSNGKYWFKVDDDDFYGENYLKDIVNIAEYADFQVFGKPTAFIFFENDNKVFLRNKAELKQHIIGSNQMPHLCGATIGGRASAFTGFSENHRACVDSGFNKKSQSTGQIIISSDIWNFIAFRAKDKNQHTWRLEDDQVKRNSIEICSGLNFDKIMF